MNHKFIVIDTNVLISAVLSSKGTPYQAFAQGIKSYILLQTKETYQELKTRIYKAKFDKYISNKRREDFLQIIKNKSQFIDTKCKVIICRDTDDNKFLELAIDGKAEFLITGDNDLLSLRNIKQYQNLILSPKEFVNLNYHEI